MLQAMHSPTRRETLGALLASSLFGKETPAAQLASGVKIGEVMPDSAVIWARRTQAALRNESGAVRKGHGRDASVLAPGTSTSTLEGACPGGNGSMRLLLEAVTGRRGKRTIDWMDLDPAHDFTRQFRLEGLSPATAYRYAVETRETRGKRPDGTITGSFRTAPRQADRAGVLFVLSSCQTYSKQDRPDGFWIYDAIEKMTPAFLVSCGDNVYYDSDDPIANSPEVARYHWQRMYSLPTLHSCLRSVPAYFQKDDHDLLSDDCWPGMTPAKQAPFTFEQGQQIFREQTPAPPSGQPMYRQFRWGSDVEIWLPDSRDYRTPNAEPDNPGKTIWGVEQKRWLKDTLSKSTARWKILVNPNPIIGPDHRRKNDNHANHAFAGEGREIRRWLQDHISGSVILMNGDRHWQYHSVDPETGLNEFGCGPASDGHAVSPSDGEDTRYHKFLRIKGGFVSARVDPQEGRLIIEHRDVTGQPVYQKVFQGKV